MSRLLPVVLPILAIVLAGCASSKGPELVRLDAALYERAFDAAVEASRRHDMPPTLRDRRSGVIETQPTVAGSVLEPWKPDNASFGQAVENTISHQRWRARFEFAAVDAPVTPADATPDLLAVATEPPVDLSAWPGQLELRVEVVVERGYVPGIRRGTWSRADTTRSTVRRPATEPDVPTGAYWTPVARDEAFERRLLAEIEKALQEPSGS